MSQKLGRKIPVEGSEKRNYMATNTNERGRTISLREAFTLLLLLVGVICLPVGAAIALGTGVAIFTVGAVAFILGVLLGVL